jgi:hypothetical protein
MSFWKAPSLCRWRIPRAELASFKNETNWAWRRSFASIGRQIAAPSSTEDREGADVALGLIVLALHGMPLK